MKRQPMRYGSLFAPLTVVKRDRHGRIASVQPVKPVHVPGLLAWTISIDTLGAKL